MCRLGVFKNHEKFFCPFCFVISVYSPALELFAKKTRKKNHIHHADYEHKEEKIEFKLLECLYKGI